MQNMLHWLLKVMLRCEQKFQDGGQLEYINILDAAATAILKVTDSGTIRGLLYIARNEDIGRVLFVVSCNVHGKWLRSCPDNQFP